MKSKTFFAALVFFLYHSAFSQVIYEENFDNLIVGDVGSDLTGATPGQGGWHIEMNSGSYTTLPDASHFQIENEPGRGKVLSLTGSPTGNVGNLALTKYNLDVLWSTRIPGNNVLKLEYDFFTGNAPNATMPRNYTYGSMVTLYSASKFLGGYGFWHEDGNFDGGRNRGSNIENVRFRETEGGLFLSKNRWYKIILYIDYDNAQVHFEIPSLGISKTMVVFDLLTPPDTISNYPPSFLSFFTRNPLIETYTPTVKLDNVKITAIGTASTVDVLGSKFNLYPNPAIDIVTIKNSDNINVKEVIIYNTSGKIIKTQGYNSTENNIQLNLDNISAGVYLLHIKTNEGETVKKLIKR